MSRIRAVGSALTVDGGAFAVDLYEFTPGNRSRESIDVTHLGSTNFKEYIPAKLEDLSEWTYTFDFVPGQADDYHNDGESHTWRITLPLQSGQTTAAYIELTGFVVGDQVGPGVVDNVMRTTLTVKPDGLNYSVVAGS